LVPQWFEHLILLAPRDSLVQETSVLARQQSPARVMINTAVKPTIDCRQGLSKL
jgi:hypothetical protein